MPVYTAVKADKAFTPIIKEVLEMKMAFFLLLLGLVIFVTVGCGRVITSGTHTIKSGSIIPGNLIISSGKILLEKGSVVQGSVIMTSGSLDVYGEVEGSILMSSGRVYVGPEAIVQGSIRGSSGSVEQAEGARVGGKVGTNIGESLPPILVAAGAAIYFLLTGRRRSVEKEPSDWTEEPVEKKPKAFL